MKKLLTLLLFVVLANQSKATLTFTLVSPPCDTNGVLAVQFVGLGVPPFQVQWLYYGIPVTHTVTGFFDTIRNFNGAPYTLVSFRDSTGALLDTGSYFGTLPLTFTLSSITTVCPAPGTVNCTVTSGTGPFTYKWYQVSTGAVVGMGSTLHLPTGNYGIWITDGSGCSSGTPVTGMEDSVLNTVAFFYDSLIVTPANCTNGKLRLSTPVGTPVAPLHFLWSNGYTDTPATGLSAGYYYVTVTDSGGCAASVGAVVPQLTTIAAMTTPSPTTCLSNDGAVIAFGAGGVPPYSYHWSTGATTQSITGVSAGTYTLVVTDSNNCVGTGSAVVTSSTPITVTYTSTPSSCTSPTGTASLYITGGTPPYHDTFYTSPIQTATIATTLAPGTYNFHVVDAVGCVRDGAVVVNPVDMFTVDFMSTPATCTLSNGSLTAYPTTGAVAPCSFTWNTGSTTSSISGQPTGVYWVTVTDANGCAKTKSAYIPDYSPLSVTSATVPATCIFTNNGSATATAYGGTPPYTYSWDNGAAGATIGGLGTGPYWVYASDASGCTAWNYDYVGYNAYDSACFCVISGNVFHDANVNCIKDLGEQGIPNIQIYCTGIGYTYTDDSGNYSFLVPTGTYTVSETIQTFYPLSGCQPNNIVVSASATTGCVHVVNFANVYDTLHDMQISTWDYTNPVPGNPYTQVTVIHNAGSVYEASPAVASYHPDGQLFGATFAPSGVFGGAGAYYDYRTTTGSGLPAMIPGASQTYYTTYNVPTFIPIGTSVVFKDTVSWVAPLDSWVTDYTPWNNVNYFTTTVQESYDPNFKEVTPKGYGAAGIITRSDSNLQYMIHFQNTGTANAQNITIIDTLDGNLNWGSLRPIYETAPCKITQSVWGQIVKFTFNNINLPPASTAPFLSNGMLTFSIKLKPGLAIGSTIHNKASIYFDYNAPIRTNTTINTIGWPVQVDEINKSDNKFFTLYPNPTENNFYIKIEDNTDAEAQLMITDITGKMLMNKNLELGKGTQLIPVSASNFAAGIYLVSISKNSEIQTQKLVIMK